MKKMVKTSLALAAVSLFSMGAIAAEGSATTTLQWGGSVPASPARDGIQVVNTGANALDNGFLVFRNDGAKVSLATSSDLQFKVYKDTNDNGIVESGDTQLTTYAVTLASLKINLDGVVNEQTSSTGFFEIKRNGAAMTVGTAVQVTDAADNIFNVSEKASASANVPKAGQSVIVQASLLITGTV
ncbi:hypothetical protein VP758_005207 [Vibrio harveyi]|nr:hypothetical protein [Vibrio harveyi]